jgi:hypothetical protein
LKTDEKPNFFREITIPGDVLNDTRLSDGAKILYGKIARLSLLDGCCWSSNAFLDGTKSGRNASRFIAELRNSGYVSVVNERGKNRRIKVCRVDSKANPAKFGDVGESERTNPANSGNVEALESIANPAEFGDVDEFGENTPANSGDVVISENANPANSGDVEELETGSPANFGEVEWPEKANPAKFGDRTSSSSLNLYNKTTTASCPDKSNGDLPTVEKVIAAACFSPEEIKAALLALDRSLIFGGGFYANAASFMAERGLGLKYLSWLLDQCALKENIRSLKAYYFSIFFLENIAEEYKAALLPEPPESKPPPPSVICICEACGEAHARSDDNCPSCGLPEYSQPDEISLYRELHKLSPQKREDYFSRREAVFEECGYEFEKLKTALAVLNQEYGLTVTACR